MNRISTKKLKWIQKVLIGKSFSIVIPPDLPVFDFLPLEFRVINVTVDWRGLLIIVVNLTGYEDYIRRVISPFLNNYFNYNEGILIYYPPFNGQVNLKLVNGFG